jgi:hypothetical protein
MVDFFEGIYQASFVPQLLRMCSMSRLIFRPTLLLFSIACMAAPCVAQIHVSPNGDDADAGTSAKPVRTLARAVEMARAMRGKAKGAPWMAT